MDVIESKKLTEQILSGDQAAFKTLVEKTARLVNHIVYKMIANRTEQEDVCQEVFIKVYQNLDRFQHNCRLSTWIGRITYNHCLNILQKRKTVLFSDISGPDETLDSLPGDYLSPADFTESNDLFRRVKSEIDLLPAHYRTALTLYHLDELTYDEIGKILKVPGGTVKSYLFRGRRLLRERLLLKYEREELCA